MTTFEPALGHDDEIGSDGAERFTREHPRLVGFARAGWVAKGVVYGLTGLLALLVAVRETGSRPGAGGEEASQSGAIASVGRQSGGALLLYVIAAGLVLYAAWRIVSVLLPTDNDARGWVSRVGYVVSAVTYLALAWTAVSFARHPAAADGKEDAKVEELTRSVMDGGLGRVLVFAVGAVLVGIGVYFLVAKAIGASFRSQLAGGGVGPLSHSALIALGRVGWVGRSVMMGLIGFFLCRAAVRFDPDEAQGLDGALQRVAGSTAGTALVVAVAVGLVVYGAFCVISAPRRLLVAADR